MIEYPKIQSLFKRDDDGNFTSEFSRPEFSYLFANEWIGTEKIDGTNVRISYSPLNGFDVRGRTDKAQIPDYLMETLDSYIFYWERNGIFESIFDDDIEEVLLFGEGYGEKIQKNGKKYTGAGTDFILFDVKIGRWWLKKEDVDDIAAKLGIKSVPIVFKASLPEAMSFVVDGFSSQVAEEEREAEGLVLTPTVPLFARNGNRVITKLKKKDFKE